MASLMTDVRVSLDDESKEMITALVDLLRRFVDLVDSGVVSDETSSPVLAQLRAELESFSSRDWLRVAKL
jgi:hypothetical protein